MTELDKIRQTKLFEILDRFPDLPNRTIARIAFAEAPELFLSIERARSSVRTYRGLNGKEHRETLKNKKYVRQSIQPTGEL